MNYIYDVIANFNNKVYDFYDWNKKDIITHIKKCLIIKTDTKTVYDLTYNSVKISDTLLENIKNKRFSSYR